MHRYDEIIDWPHHVSTKRPQMSRIDRAAQFSPFAALTGYDAAVRETARLTDERVELDESKKSMLNEKLWMVLKMLGERPEVSITYFVPDERKAGGSYECVTGVVGRIDELKRIVVMADKTVVPIEQIFEIDGEWFNQIKEI